MLKKLLAIRKAIAPGPISKPIANINPVAVKVVTTVKDIKDNRP